MNIKIIGYIGVIIIGIGFIIMGESDIFHNDIASVFQIISGVIFIVVATLKITFQHTKKDYYKL